MWKHQAKKDWSVREFTLGRNATMEGEPDAAAALLAPWPHLRVATVSTSSTHGGAFLSLVVAPAHRWDDSATAAEERWLTDWRR